MYGRHRVLVFACAATASVLVIRAPLGAPPEPSPVAAGKETVSAIDQALRICVTIEGDGIYGSGFMVDPPRGQLLHAAGEIVAVMSFIYRNSQGLAFALPIVDARSVFPDAFGAMSRRDRNAR